MRRFFGQTNLFFYANLDTDMSMNELDQPTDPLEIFWDNLLSREPARIRAAFNALDRATQSAVLNHLERMATEEGWHPEQVSSARAALKEIKAQ